MNLLFFIITLALSLTLWLKAANGADPSGQLAVHFQSVILSAVAFAACILWVAIL